MKKMSNHTMKAIFIVLFIFICISFSMAYQLDFDYDKAVKQKTEDRCTIYTKPDGTRIKKCPDREEALLKDKTKIVRYPDGRRNIHAPDGMNISIGTDGNAKYIYPDGREKTVSMDGKTPYGLEIKAEKKIVRNDFFTLEIVYSAALSDDVLDGHMKRFFDEIVAQAEKQTARGKYKNGTAVIEISNCRFCKTGYCRRNNKEGIAVVFFLNAKKKSGMSVKHIDIADKKKCVTLAETVAGELFK